MARRDTTTTMMATGDDDINVHCNSATGNKVDNDGDGKDCAAAAAAADAACRHASSATTASN